MIHKAQAHTQERQHQVQAEQMPLDKNPAPIRHTRTPHTTDLDPVSNMQGEGYTEADWPRKEQ